MPPRLLELVDLAVTHNGPRGTVVEAVAGVSLTVASGESLGLVGESGCGKTSLARAALQLPPPTSGKVWFGGEDLTRLSRRRLRAVRPALQMVFQDPLASLNPARTVARTLETPLRVLGIKGREQRRRRVVQALEAVGLAPDWALSRYPCQLSGGQCQRVSIARALMTDPRLLVCDEPVSALDVSVQAQILNLLEEVKHRLGLTLLFISHDLAVVKRVCNRVAVMYLGKLCEVASADRLFSAPAHPYTRALLSAVPTPDPARAGRHLGHLHGELPSPAAPPTGCRFHPRCLHRTPRCAREAPPLGPAAPQHEVACHLASSPGNRELSFQ